MNMSRLPKTINRRSELRSSHTRRWLSAAMLWCIVMSGIAPVVINAQAQVSGNISPRKIEIDTAANLNAGDGTILNGMSAGTPVDWQKDTLANTDPPSLPGGVATGIIPGTSGRVGGTGHWYGARL